MGLTIKSPPQVQYQILHSNLALTDAKWPSPYWVVVAAAVGYPDLGSPVGEVAWEVDSSEYQE